MDHNQAENFQQLVLRLKADKSYDAIEKLSGGAPTGRSLQKLLTKGFTRMPDPETFQGLSRALNVPQRDLVLAAARTLGIYIEAENPADLTLVGAGRLPYESQELLRSTSRELQRWLERDQQHTVATDDSKQGATADVHELFPVHRAAADKGDQGIDPEQLPES
ncbi:hypothetical protein [Glutamicibacter sp. M10]|uniref:hypothetical protein n=1 Tax=Glutamicibacter sp. M10 TaxID=3023076 RepID=UPI0021C85A04|nr:hypothetical protein [Glutamicibacter sp. M10]UXN30973.1 hypothetical protein N6V40_11125 [Glutamicibacter sp. M10]